MKMIKFILVITAFVLLPVQQLFSQNVVRDKSVDNKLVLDASLVPLKSDDLSFSFASVHRMVEDYSYFVVDVGYFRINETPQREGGRCLFGYCPVKTLGEPPVNIVSLQLGTRVHGQKLKLRELPIAFFFEFGGGVANAWGQEWSDDPNDIRSGWGFAFYSKIGSEVDINKHLFLNFNLRINGFKLKETVGGRSEYDRTIFSLGLGFNAGN